MKFETLYRKWEDEFLSAEPSTTLHEFIALKVRTLVQGRRWRWLVAEVHYRDKGICQVCGISLELINYHCGHIIDRCVGGKDELENLLAMCVVCNMLKPLHRSVEEFGVWRAASSQFMRLISEVKVGI